MPNSAEISPSPTPSLRRLPLTLSPHQVCAAWPANLPLAALWSGGDTESSRWTVLALPSHTRTLSPTTPTQARDALASLIPPQSTLTSHDPDTPPFQGGTIAAISYDLGPILEPASSLRYLTHPPTLILAHTCHDALIYDHHLNTWWSLGTPPDLTNTAHPTFSITDLHSETTPAAYQANVERILEYIRAGDIYQANLAHHLRATFTGSTRALFLALAAAARPWYGSYLESQALTIASASPELFINFNPHTRTLTTRPMKGTSPAAHADALSASDKDAAELNMITDLMRNDLGAVCDLGSVHVQRTRDLETHGDTGQGHLAQTTSTISGTLRQTLTVADALASMLPGGSVTGCPKIRAMQIIEELEPSPRSFYCGSIGYISRTGHAAFNIAIRTATIESPSLREGLGWVDATQDTSQQASLQHPNAQPPSLRPSVSPSLLTYPVGAGIVIDSNPAAEWQETLDKAGVLERVIDSKHP